MHNRIILLLQGTHGRHTTSHYRICSSSSVLLILACLVSPAVHVGPADTVLCYDCSSEKDYSCDEYNFDKAFKTIYSNCLYCSVSTEHVTAITATWAWYTAFTVAWVWHTDFTATWVWYTFHYCNVSMVYCIYCNVWYTAFTATWVH